MIGLNFIFHIAASLALVLAVFWIVFLQRRVRLWRQIYNAQAQKQPFMRVGRIDQLLNEVAGMVGIPFEDNSQADQPLVALNLAELMQLHLSCGLRMIRLHSSSAEKSGITIDLNVCRFEEGADLKIAKSLKNGPPISVKVSLPS